MCRRRRHTGRRVQSLDQRSTDHRSAHHRSAEQRTDDPSTNSTPAGSSTSTVAADDGAGSTAAAELLRERNWLSPEGRLYFGETQPDEPVQAAICEYLFGTPGDVSETALLPAEATLSEGSGYTILGGTGTGFDCIYVVDGTPVFEIVLWDREIDAGDAGVAFTVELPTEGYGGIFYHPDYDGDALDEAAAEEWLQDAAQRVM